jgi:hypothetical protein
VLPNMQRIILMCAGSGTRWNNHLGMPKHLIRIGNERLIDRTVRLIKARSSAEIFIASFDPAYEVVGATLFDPSKPRDVFVDTDKFLSCIDKWSADDRTILLYGDVFFTPKAMDTILAVKDEYTFFGRPGPSRWTGRRWAELYALSFLSSARHMIQEAMLTIRQMLATKQIRRGGGWEVYRHLQNLNPVCMLQDKIPIAQAFITIDDFTDDFDFPDDYETWMRHMRAYQNRGKSLWKSSFT